RGRAVTGLAAALASGELQLDRGTDRDVVHEQLISLPGVGPWTADYVALRALGHPDVFLPTDVGIKRALEVLGAPAADVAAWRPWRSYALLYLWTSLTALEKL
ncbi:DNA-3-methyladenine glycosylase 2 family protein, partial [Nocardioides sp. NPDC000441]